MKNNLDIILEDAAKVWQHVSFASLEGKTIYITGATGLLGTHFLASLLLLKESGMDIKVYGQYHSEPPDYTYEMENRGDFFLTKDLDPVIADVIIHAAGYAQPSIFMANLSETIRVNTTRTQELLKTTLRPGGRFLFVSSSEVYSGLTKSSAQESDIGMTTPYHPRACYIESKRCGEAIVNAYHKNGVNASSARLSLAYGPGTRKYDKRAMSTLIEKALTTGEIRMDYAGKELRSFCYIRDAVEVLWRIVLEGTQPVYNVGGHLITRMADIAAAIGKITNTKVIFPQGKEEMLGAPEIVHLDTSRIEAEFGKFEYVGLEEGLERTVDWQRGLYV